MKSILYLGAVLMIGASIYGFVDYKKTSRNEKFKNMYAEKEITEPVAIPEKENVIPATEPVVEIKTVTPAKSIKENAVLKKAGGRESAGTIVKNNGIKKQKKLNTELFSRAPLREYQEVKETSKTKKIKTEEIKPMN